MNIFLLYLLMKARAYNVLQHLVLTPFTVDIKEVELLLLTADLTVSTTGGILHTFVIFSTNGSCLHSDVVGATLNDEKSSPFFIFGYVVT